MAELAKLLRVRKNGQTQNIKAYSALEDVGENHITVIIDNALCYVSIGELDDLLATSARVLKNGKVYALKSEAIPPKLLTLVFRNVVDNSVIATKDYIVPKDGVLYFNNQNAPVVTNYDFVSIEGIKKTGVGENDVIDVYYVANFVTDRTRTSWKRYYKDNANITDVYLNTYNATDMYYMFYGCSSLKTITRLNTSNVTDMNHMFYKCKALTSVPEMDTSKVTNMHYMFYECGALISVPEMDTSNVTDMERIFYKCKALTSVPKMDTSKVTDMNRMFYECNNLLSVPEMDTSKVTNMEYMFYECYALTSVPDMDTSKVTTMQAMFEDCDMLDSVPVLNTSKVTNMNSMFAYSSKLLYVPYMDTSKVTDMARMFIGCYALTSINWEIDMRSCKDCTNMFAYAGIKNVKLKNVPRSLDLSEIGTANYTVVNYID